MRGRSRSPRRPANAWISDGRGVGYCVRWQLLLYVGLTTLSYPFSAPVLALAKLSRSAEIR